jgi:hypothetical protein
MLETNSRGLLDLKNRGKCEGGLENDDCEGADSAMYREINALDFSLRGIPSWSI